jgi:outer membrane biosynthesis protein TonB
VSARPGGGGKFGRQTEPDEFVLGGSIGRRSSQPDRRSLWGSLAVHAGLVGAILVATFLQAQDLPEFETFTVQIYSPPPQVEGPPQPEPPPPEVTPTIVSRPTVDTPPAVTTKPVPPKPVEQTPVEKPVEKPPEPEPVTGTAADPESTGGENIDIDNIGADFPFPDYLENIIRQINRHFRGWSGDATPSAQIAFYINRDGTIGGLTLVEKSPDFKFNLQTMSAVELAGRNNAFGELPEGWVSDRLWVRFRFIPPGR